MSILETLPVHCQTRIADLTERRQHQSTMYFPLSDSYELAAWEALIAKLEGSIS